MNEEINKIINWIEMSYTRLNYKEELLLVNYIKQLKQENARLKDKIEKAINKLEYYNCGEALWYVPIDAIIEDYLK